MQNARIRIFHFSHETPAFSIRFVMRKSFAHMCTNHSICKLFKWITQYFFPHFAHHLITFFHFFRCLIFQFSTHRTQSTPFANRLFVFVVPKLVYFCNRTELNVPISLSLARRTQIEYFVFSRAAISIIAFMSAHTHKTH